MRHLIDNNKKYLYTGIILIVITIMIHISTSTVKNTLLDYVEMEENFAITDEINEDTVAFLTYGDEILLYHDEVEIRGQITMWMYIASAVLVVAGGAGIVLEQKEIKEKTS